AFWANYHMFHQLKCLSESKEITMTVFVDDLTFSGNKVTRQFKQQVHKIINQNNQTMHPKKTVLYKVGATKIITGVAVNSTSILVSNRHHDSIRSDMVRWVAVKQDNSMPELKSAITNKLLGKLNSQAQVEPRFRDKARSVKTASNST
ncbi:MAG: hypothetical protein V7784_16820, partial [Oceanospirillaceae bacterium]